MKNLLKEAKYDGKKIKYLTEAFKKGFSLCYQGPTKVARKANKPEIKSWVSS